MVFDLAIVGMPMPFKDRQVNLKQRGSEILEVLSLPASPPMIIVPAGMEGLLNM